MTPGRLNTDRIQRGLNKLVGDRSISNYEAGWPQIQLWLRTVLNCWLSREEGTLPHPPFLLSFYSHHLLGARINSCEAQEMAIFVSTEQISLLRTARNPGITDRESNRQELGEPKPGAPSGRSRRVCRVPHTTPSENGWKKPNPSLRKPWWGFTEPAVTCTKKEWRTHGWLNSPPLCPVSPKARPSKILEVQKNICFGKRSFFSINSEGAVLRQRCLDITTVIT